MIRKISEVVVRQFFLAAVSSVLVFAGAISAHANTLTFTGVVATNDGLSIGVGEEVTGRLSFDSLAFLNGNVRNCTASSLCTEYNNVLQSLTVSIGSLEWSMIDPVIGEVIIDDDRVGGSYQDSVTFSSTVRTTIDNADGPAVDGAEVRRVQFALGSPSDVLSDESGLNLPQILALANNNVIGGALNFLAFETGEVRYSITSVAAVPLPATGLLLVGAGLGFAALKRRSLKG